MGRCVINRLLRRGNIRITAPRLILRLAFWIHVPPFRLLPPDPPSPLHPPCSFDVSLTCGRDSEKEERPYDVALKLTVRFADRQFLRAARVSGKWIGEEASTSYFPFIPDQPFRVKIFFFLTLSLFSFDFLMNSHSRVESFE